MMERRDSLNLSFVKFVFKGNLIFTCVLEIYIL
jgi:hypothetical protein